MIEKWKKCVEILSFICLIIFYLIVWSSPITTYIKYIFIIILFPITLIVFYLLSDLILSEISSLSTIPLFSRDLRKYAKTNIGIGKNLILLIIYYVVFSLIVLLFIKLTLVNLYSFESLNLEEIPPSQLALTSIMIAFIPRIFKITKGPEYSKKFILSLMTPLFLLSLPVLIQIPSDFVSSGITSTLFIFPFALIMAPIGDYTIDQLQQRGLIKIDLKSEAILSFNINETIEKEPYTYNYDKLFQIWDKAIVEKQDSILRKIENSIQHSYKIALKEDILEVRLEILKWFNNELQEYKKYGFKYLQEITLALLEDHNWFIRLNCLHISIKHYDNLSKHYNNEIMLIKSIDKELEIGDPLILFGLVKYISDNFNKVPNTIHTQFNTINGKIRKFIKEDQISNDIFSDYISIIVSNSENYPNIINDLKGITFEKLKIIASRLFC